MKNTLGFVGTYWYGLREMLTDSPILDALMNIGHGE